MKARVYRNLTKKCYSVIDCATGRVCLRTRRILLHDCRFVVRPAGRAKVLREKRKNVHAFVVGIWDEQDRTCRIKYPELSAPFHFGFKGLHVSYDPYKNPQFVLRNGQPIFKASSVFLNEAGVLAQP